MSKENGKRPDIPTVTWCIQKNLVASGSEFYRVHRPAHLITENLNWMGLVATHFAPPEKAGELWRVQIQDTVVNPPVIITRPIFRMIDEDDEVESAEKMTQAIAYAQEQGQVIIGDIDDHPFGWNGEFADREGKPPIEDWGWYDRWISQLDAVLCSTRALQMFLAPRYPDQLFAYAPNCYDPYRYHPERAKPGKHFGAHLWVKARYRDDFERLGGFLRDLFEKDDDLRFVHHGEEFSCVHCHHSVNVHFEGRYCDDCACEDYSEPMESSLARLAEIPAGRVIREQSSNILTLHDHITWNIGVVPLADNEWNYAKTEGKGFEMAAAGLPFIALTGDHPLYQKAPRGKGLETDHAYRLATDKGYWRYWHDRSVKWARSIAVEHQADYLAALHGLSRMDLRKAS